MNQQMKRNLLPLLLIALAGFSLVGCGSSKTSSEGFGSAAQSSTITGNESTSALCSRDASGLADSHVQLQQFIDQYGQTRSDYIRVKISAAPAAWQTGNWDLLIYRWTAAPDGSTTIDPTPLSYRFEKKVSGAYQLLAPTVYQIFNWTDTEAMGAHAGVSATSPQDFYGATNLLVDLKDTTNSYQAMRVVLKQNGIIQREMDVLIPTFTADPARYAADSRHPAVLQNLHPLKDKLGQNWSQPNYYEFARAFCF